jgi:membrane associated rhomboid family serine protease
MRQPPPLLRLPRYPIVGGVGILAIGVSLAFWSETVDVTPLLDDHHVRKGEVWRLATSVLPHGDPIHLVFNLVWLWVLGTLVEDVFGHARALGLILLLAVGSSAAEHAFFHGGIGLSGVGYGLFGFLWVLSRRDPRFRDAIDPQTVGLFVGWFFLCIVLTVADAWNVANLAHGAGALLGALLGLAVAAGKLRPLYGAALVLVMVGFGAAVYARPYINLTSERAHDRASMGLEALDRQDDEAAVRHLRAALAAPRAEPDASWWYNLGLAYERRENYDAAKAAYQRGAERSDPDYADAVTRIETLQGEQRTSDTPATQRNGGERPHGDDEQ